jgi:hypothetical protein
MLEKMLQEIKKRKGRKEGRQKKVNKK